MTPIPRKPLDAGSHDQQMTPAVQAVIDAADKRMPAGCTTPDGCRQHGCHGACLPRDMTPAETTIRAALAAGPTPGPWRVDADGCRAGPEDGFSPFGGCGCCGSPWMSGATDAARQADAELIAACNPANVAELLAELDGLRAERKPLTEEQMLECVRSVLLPTPMGLTRDRGPYEVTEPTYYLQMLIRAVERAHGIGD